MHETNESFSPCIYWARCHNHIDEERDLSGQGSQLCYGLWFVHDGTLIATQEDKQIALRPGQAGLTEPGWNLMLTSGSSCVCIVFDLFYRHTRRQNENGTYSILQGAQAQPSLVEAFGISLPWPFSETATHEARRLIDYTEATYWRSKLQHHTCSARLAHWLLEQGSQDQGTIEDEHSHGDGVVNGLAKNGLAKNVDDLIRERSSMLSGVEEISEILGVSVATIHRHFKKYYNQTPAQAIEQYRILKAENLLRKGLDITTIAERVGYTSHSAFTRAFKRRQGMTPLQWKHSNL